MSEPIDWGLAASTARWVSAAGPRSNLRQAREETRALREAALVSVEHVRRISGLDVAPDSPVLVVDRPTWARANADSLQVLLTPGLPEASALGASLSGVQAGGLLSLLSTRVLGQYDPFVDRLLLVAPNVMQVRQQLNVRPQDFRLWVCLHEQTHRVQFAAAPWLRDWLHAQITALLASLAEGSLTERVSEMLNRSTAPDDRQSGSLLDVVADDEQLSRITAVMSLLEGHANVVMDGVDRTVVPTVKTIRRRFTERGQNASVVTQLLRRLTGMEAKARQYRDGQRFVNRAIELMGTEGFNQVWTSPDLLPTEAEIHDADAWVARL